MNDKKFNIDCTSARKYYKYISDTLGKANADVIFSNDSLEKENDGPFLSVIMRTQGKRPLAIKEALLCLSAQTDTDFELLIVGHNLDEKAKSMVNESIDECPDWMQKKIRLIEVNGGNRTTPLNTGFSEAKGTYISIYDDDDLIFDNWVETFKELYKENPGTILHAYAVGQDWKTIETENGRALISVSSFENLYCKDFEFIKQLSQNFCPTMSLAFPAFAFQKFGIHFNETLTTTEDWDFLMRTSFICGVSNSENVTSVYRKWTNEQNSTVLHKKDEWEKNHKNIQAQFLDYYYPLKIESLKDLMYSVGNSPVMPSNLEHVEVFIDSGSGFQSNKTAKLKFEYSNNYWIAKAYNMEDYGEIKKIRFDPDDFGIISVDDLNVNIYNEKNELVDYRIEYLRSNYVKYKNSDVFISIDPQIVFQLKTPSVCSQIDFSFNVTKTLPAKKIIVSVFKFTFAHCLRKIARAAYHVACKIKRGM